ncbi:MFS transporter [Micromonospora sp. URMC 106]|uniref:MFS transporter n=1 Tax=Micromonospora sp. URMC 106 TaxID=3423408 RepID=UPI003F1CCC2A
MKQPQRSCRSPRPDGLARAGQALVGIGIAVTAIQAASIRQAATPPHLLGRTVAAYRLLSYGTIPLGGLLGGVLGDAVGLRAALAIAAAAGCAALIPLLCSAIRSLHEPPIEETS